MDGLVARLSRAVTLDIGGRLLWHNVPNGSSEQNHSAEVNPDIVIKSELAQVHCDGGDKPKEEWAIPATATSAGK
jgi:hypothetical protein